MASHTVSLGISKHLLHAWHWARYLAYMQRACTWSLIYMQSKVKNKDPHNCLDHQHGLTSGEKRENKQTNRKQQGFLILYVMQKVKFVKVLFNYIKGILDNSIRVTGRGDRREETFVPSDCSEAQNTTPWASWPISHPDAYATSLLLTPLHQPPQYPSYKQSFAQATHGWHFSF